MNDGMRDWSETWRGCGPVDLQPISAPQPWGEMRTDMISTRRRKTVICRQLRNRLRRSSIEDRLWDSMRPVGREFGSPDFERLMEEDQRRATGVFAPDIEATWHARTAESVD